MSDYLAVGGVTAVLRYLLTSALTSGGPSAVLTSATAITAVSPDLIQVSNSEEPQLNLFMYYVSLNPALRNLGLPSRDASGSQVSNPPLALNLHYLVSAYGSTPGTQLTAEILLGWAMKVFHDTPVVPPQTIQDALTALLTQSSAEAKLVGTSTLAGQIEHIRITPETLTTEEIYRLWPAFQAPYRPSSAFQVSVVVIRDTSTVSAALPVQHRRLVALPLKSPVITAISPAMATAGQKLTISGANFLGQGAGDTVVSFDSLSEPVAAGDVTGTVVQVTLPSKLLAGTQLLRVQRMVTFPGETNARQGFSSTPAAFQLVPVIKATTTPIPATLGSPLILTISPPVGQAQPATVYIGDTAIPLGTRPVGAPATDTTLTFTVPAEVGTGTFPIRVEIAGATSTLTQQPGGQWTPQVAVT